jgi:hypothetical protein
MFNILLADASTSPASASPAIGVWLGQVAIVVGILAAVVSVVWFFGTVLGVRPKPIKVEFQLLDFPSSGFVEEAFEFLGSNMAERTMARLVFDLPVTTEKRLELCDLSALLVKAIKDRFAHKLPPPIGGAPRAITFLKIENTGRKIQTSVNLSIDQADYFLIKKSNKWVPQVAADGQVSLGDMQAHDEIEVCSWGRTSWNRMSSGWLKVRSNEGNAVIKYEPWESPERFIRRNVLYGVAICGGTIIVAWVLKHWLHLPS